MDFFKDIIIWLITIAYSALLIYTTIRILLENETQTSRTAIYLYAIWILPVVGFLVYYATGTNRRKQKIYGAKRILDEKQHKESIKIFQNSQKIIADFEKKFPKFSGLIRLFSHEMISSNNNRVELLINGDEKFEKLKKDLLEAKNHIHLEYYIFEPSQIADEIIEILIQKSSKRVRVRFLYDALGSRYLSEKKIEQMQNAGVEIFPFFELKPWNFLNRINYRNHRKIVVIDGKIGYVGGINVSDLYVNSIPTHRYGRDTHLKIEGKSVWDLQRIFLYDWNFSSEQNLGFDDELFPDDSEKKYGNALVDITASGPDSSYPNILYALLTGIALSQKEILITTPYFVPNISFLDSLKIAALSGKKIKLLVPKTYDSKIIELTTQSFFGALLDAGVEIFQYQKGFIHAKTIVYDREVSVIGTANLDNRSFDLNFEVNATVYDTDFSQKLAQEFEKDLQDSEKIDPKTWKNRPFHRKLLGKILNLFAPLM